MPKIDDATRFVHDCMRERLVDGDAPIVHAYAACVFAEGRRDHVVRALETLRLLSDRDLLRPGMAVGETGDLGDVGEALVQAGHPCAPLRGDLRVRIEADDRSIDLLLSLEVFEHLQDLPPAHWRESSIFHENGARAFAAECARIVRPGGRLVLTTPNATSLFSMIQLLEGKAPMLWRKHVREYTIGEVRAHFEAVGFVLEHVETWYAYHFLRPSDLPPLLARYLTPLDVSHQDRGDDAAFIFRRA